MLSYRSLILPALFSCAAPSFAADAIAYEVTPFAHEKSFHIRMDIPNVRELTVRVQIPVWSPGAYASGNYAANIADFSATDFAGKSLKVYRPDQNTWEIAANGAKSVSVRYTVNSSEMEEDNGAPKRGHLRGPRTYLYVVGRKTDPATLTLIPPTGAKSWPLATSLDPIPNSSMKQTKASSFSAPNYDTLADAPVEMGDFLDETFEAGGKPHRIVLYGKYSNVDRGKLREYSKRVAEIETAFFGDAPFNRYVFMYRAAGGTQGGAGGLEHLGSTEIGLSGIVEDGARSTIAHEYFHLWNVKRIRPFVLGPFNYVDPPATANLWWSEGVTSYYADLLSKRGGINTEAEYLTHLGQVISSLQNTPARLKVSADQSSLHVFEVNNSQGFGGLSYYTKGELVGLCLDLKIRQETNGKASLDDVMRSLYKQCGQGKGPGFKEDAIKETVNKISGRNLSDFYDLAARSTEELPFAECLSYAGLKYSRVEPAEVVGDLGMTMGVDRTFQALLVNEVASTGAAASAGLKVGDKIVAVNGQSDLQQMPQMRRAKPGAKFKLTVQRGDQKLDLDYAIGSMERYRWQVTVDPSATEAQKVLRHQWLAGLVSRD